MRRKRLQKMRQLEDGDVTFFEAVLVWLGKVGIVVEDDEVNGRIHQNVQGNVSRFLNRILGLRIVRQHVLFDYFHSVLEYHVKEAKRDGTYEDGIRSLTGASCSVSVMRALDLPEETGLAKGEVEAVKVTIDKSMTFQQILPKYHFAKEETDRRIELAKKMQAERVAAGNKVNQRQIFSKTGFWTKRSGTEVYLVVDYPGRVTSGYSTYGVKRPVTVWSPCRGRVEISYKAFLNHHFRFQHRGRGLPPVGRGDDPGCLPATGITKPVVGIIKDKQDTDVFVLRGSRLLMAWPHLDKAFSFLYGGPSAETKKKDKTVRSPVVHVKAAAPSDPLEEAFAAAAAETLKEFNASCSEEDCGTALVSQEDAGKSFIALQLPTTRSINEHMANQIFDVLERGRHCWLEVVAQGYAIGEGWAPDLVERAFTNGDRERLFRIRTAIRSLTIKVFNVTKNPLIREGLDGPETACDEDAIRRLALNFHQDPTNMDDFRSVIDYMDHDGGGGGHGGMRAMLALCEAFGFDLAMGPEMSGLVEYVEGSTEKCMELHCKGHWNLVVLNYGNEDDEATTKVGSASDVLDFIEERVDSSLAELAATRTGDDATTTRDGAKPNDIDVGSESVFSDSTTAPPSPASPPALVTHAPIPEHIIATWSDADSPASPPAAATTDPSSEHPSHIFSRASWASHPWDDDEHWDDYQKYLGHNSFFAEEDEEVCFRETLWREWTRGPEEVCVFPSVWSEWTRMHPRQHGRVRGSGGRRKRTRKNKKHRFPRRRQDRRRRAAVRRKRLARRARVGGRHRRPRTCFLRGGARPEQDEQVTGEVTEQETGQRPEATVVPSSLAGPPVSLEVVVAANAKPPVSLPVAVNGTPVAVPLSQRPPLSLVMAVVSSPRIPVSL
ncbi:conserved unknown protein [Ectocarpus siliculosus]|uniref:Strawberry notch helicase C domain-containing protein n=1 Tax=Ectocarpus siliculosus TaxID=2880 RepID=D7G3R9_ECTSI|nr:conserved unknown protein [Ectocarpus siliculosus]|eukprot:CBJ33596.1 conserved unknown protein [Ectocarpus siliculosus]